MRLIKNREVRKIIIEHVELTLIFLFDYLLCKIGILESLKVLLDERQKLLFVDGTLVKLINNILQKMLARRKQRFHFCARDIMRGMQTRFDRNNIRPPASVVVSRPSQPLIQKIAELHFTVPKKWRTVLVNWAQKERWF